ncbi:Integrase core domain protein [Lentilactobacillus parabuchneri]|uniref:Integrase core domain protein n=2 Tax=Lentilactobacillus TaxID=2767893 RepID=A0A1X1FB57_9LACO|nr:Integrase core domain protein [Lentilactobacillus parabuchneri]ORN24532.1 Integrase core domain protein [Lentilactobacillus parabuchneri]
MELSRAAYYKWLGHEPTVHELENQAIYEYIKQLEETNHYIFGVNRLVTYINQETSYQVGPTRVRNIMRRGNIKASIRVAKHDRQAEKKEFVLANKLLTADAGHDFHPSHPNEVWVTDCSELPYGVNGTARLRLSAIKDLYDHSIVSWKVASTETADLVTDTFKAAIKNNHGVKPRLIHSDQGSSYTSGRYNTALAGMGIVHSMSRLGTPGDNSPMESFWSHIKTEFFAFEQPLSEIEMITLIQKCINWYNNERRQRTTTRNTQRHDPSGIPESYR